MQPVLSVYDPTLHTEVHTDANAIGLAAALLQRQNDERQSNHAGPQRGLSKLFTVPFATPTDDVT